MDPVAAQNLIARFDRLSLRERLLSVAAVAALVFAALYGLLLNGLDVKRQGLEQQLASLQGSMTTAANTVEALSSSDATSAALAQVQALRADLDKVNADLATQAAGMIPPNRIPEVIHDLLSQQKGVTLISLRNLPARTVVDDAHPTGPYVHPVELVVEGSYLDVLAYLQALERLPWRFYWRTLDLQAAVYPVNRVRVELGTVSLDKAWIGL
jgi:MSHA biogenesis protein MshJ